MVGCATKPKAATIRGADLYARLDDLRDDGRATVPSSKAPVVVRLDQYLVDQTRGQIFVVDQVVAGCDGIDISRDPDCTLALIGDQRFTITDAAPAPRRPRTEEDDRDAGLSARNKTLIVLLVAGTAMTVSAVKCDAFEGCGTLLGIGAAADALLLLALLGAH